MLPAARLKVNKKNLVAFVVLLISWPVRVSAQLNENCIVSVLNRSTQVNPDGSWVLPNVPANFGQVRARATCVQNGVTTFGQSDFFSLGANQTVNLPHVTLGNATPIPQSLSVTAPAATLNQAGQTTQLTVMAGYAGGTTQNVTAPAAGTQYNISNPAIATVTSNGLVTAVGSGTAIIQAVNEGAQGLITIQVVLSVDSDGDGIPDDAELRLGLNPHDPTDALLDPDHDGLTNLQEYRLGTDIHNPDTDGDGLTDGQEVLIYHTNPLVASTDGSGIPDGVQVQTGTLGASFSSKLAAALASLEVKPGTFTLTVSSIVGQASQQLTVLGHLIDGKTTIDLTSTQKGTNYSSSDLTICNFGSPDGNVFAGSNGSCTITITNGSVTTSASGIVTGFSPTPLSWVSIPGFANNVDVSGNYAYVAAGSTGLQIVDVSDRTHPRVVSALGTPGNANDVQVVGRFAYVSGGSSGIHIVDVTNPLAPVLRSSFSTPGVAWNLMVSGGIAYVADGASGLQVIDVSNPAAPVKLGSLALSGTVKGLDVDPSRNLAVAVGTAGLFTISIANPAAPVLVGSLNYGGDPRDVAVKGNVAFVADFTRSLSSVDISNPANPLYKASTDPNLGGLLEDVVISGNFALGADVKFVNGVPIVDISNAPVLQPRAILNFPPGDSRGFRDDNAYGIAADGAYVYFTAGQDAFAENGVTGDTRLYIGQYTSAQDKNGIPPTALIVAPVDGSTAIQGNQLQITVQANDDVAVAAVNILVNGQVVFTATSAPYQFMYQVPVTATVLTIGAQAIDFGNNVGTAKPVTVTAIPDPLTSVRGRVTDTGNNPVAGANVICQGKNSVSAADGTFSMAGLSTIQGPIQCSATAAIAGLLGSGFASVAPVRGGITDVGAIVLSLSGSRGRDFWLPFSLNPFNQTAQIFIVSDGTANYSASNSSVSFNVTGTVTAQSPAVVALPLSNWFIGGNFIGGNQNQSIHVTTDADVAVFYMNIDAYLALPTPSLGTEYFALSYANNVGYASTLTVIASQDATNVTISNACGATTPLSATLNHGQTYLVQCGAGSDASGSHVVSDNPVAVLAEGLCVDVPAGVSNCSQISEMMFPLGRLWGTEIYSAPLPGSRSDVYRVIAARDGTTVAVDQGGGNVQTLNLNQGQFQELQFKAGARFTSNQPILVMQYMTGRGNGGTGPGDPFSMQLVPVTNFVQSSRFYAPPNQGWTNNAIIIAPTSAIGSVQLNGTAVSGFTQLPGGAYQYAVVAASDGQNVVTSPQAVAVYSIGLQTFVAYGAPTRF